jgi:S-(hydroxymethyl)glutathione dehydrogenase/alcohol dehydrogenase
MTVHAAVARSAIEPLRIEEVQLRAPGPGEVLVQMKASGICHSDLSVWQGKLPLPLPMILGHEGAGIVLECGSGVDNVRPGDHVILNNVPECGECACCRSPKTNYCNEIDAGRAQGSPFSLNGEVMRTMSRGATFATHTVLRDYYLTPIPRDMPFASAALVSCGVMTGVGSALFTARVDAGSTVVVFGMGSIGLNAVQGARLAGAGRIIAVDTQPAKEASALRFGATDFLLAGADASPVDAAIRALLGGPADYAFECVGSPALMRMALSLVHPHWGVCLAIGITPYDQDITLPGSSFYLGRSMRGTFIGDGKPRTETPRLLQWYREGKLLLDELVSHRLGLEQINDGFDLMRRGAAIRSVIEY